MKRLQIHGSLLPLDTMSRILFFCLFVACTSYSAPPGKPPTGGEDFIAPEKLLPSAFHVGIGKQFGSKQVHDAKHGGFNEKLQVRVTKRPPNTWDVALRAPSTVAVKKGDALLIGFWARGKAADGTGGGVAEFAVERNGAPYEKSVQYLVETPVDGTWAHYWVRCKSLQDYEAGALKIVFQAGYLPMTFEVGGVQAINYGKRKPLDDLPYTPLTYVGREKDAPWRAAAAQRIEQHRKADLNVIVTDKAGKPKPGVTVHIKLDRLDFDFGSAVKAKLVTEESASAIRYRETFLKHFNLAVIENNLKMKQWQQWPKNRPQAIKALHWLNEKNIPVRGHVMVWPGYRYLPKSFETMARANDKEALSTAIDAHIHSVGSAAGELVRDWDVLNEVYANRELTNILGDEAMIHWFKQARSVAPNAKLYYNDYAGLVRGGLPTTHKDHYEETLRYLIDNGAPIDGMGIQGHFGSLLTPPYRLLRELDRWASLDLKILITEFDVTVPGDQLRADFVRDFMTMCFSHPSVTGILSWGFWSEAHWRPEAAFFDKEWNTTKMGEAWIELVNQTWTTDATLKTDKDGQINLRAFLGNYTLSTESTTQTFDHKKGGSRLTVKLH